MILVDTSLWLDHLRTGDEVLATLPNRGEVMSHPFVIGELVCGNLRNRSEVLALLKSVPKAPVATDAEVLFFNWRHELMGRGIGYVDAHLLAVSNLAGSARLWTSDKRLKQGANSLELCFEAD